ncbi:MAG: glycoside hydrolase family 78 protein [Niabella sp.]|nr:glycoside hydrolase family 78 protein [Niabella sp.]
MRFRFMLFFIGLAFFARAQLQVQNLTVEQLASPIGIATLEPRFSWQLSSDKRDVKQTAYEILVASSKAALEKNRGDVWSSGTVNSDNTLFVPFKGSSLQSNRYYYVKVKSVTNKGEETWSKPVFFTVGFVNPSDWKAKWIGYDGSFAWDSITTWSRLSARYFRKEFPVSKKIKKAFVNIVGLGMYELMINGKKIGDAVLTPAPTDYRKSVLSNTYDVTEHISAGKNAMGVVVGNGRFFTMRQNYKPYKINNFGFPKLLLQLDIIYEDGSKETIVSDQSWKFTADGPIRTNNEYDGEEYDATKELGAWSSVNYNDARWMQPQLVKAPLGKVQPQPNPSMKVMERIQPKSINKLKGGVYILDMGQNFAGWLQIKVSGKKGDKVKMRFGESLQPDGTLYVANLRDARATDVYTVKGDGEEVWHPQFVYHGFRYVEISGWPGTPDVNDFEGQLVFDQMQTTGQLITSNATLNQILKNAWWGIASNYKGMPVDCPQRNERQPWLGDRTQGALGESFLFDNATLYAKWLDDIEQSQTKDGAIPDVAPAFWNYYSDNVTWPAAYILVADMLYRQYGDQQPVVKHYSSMKKWMNYMQRKYMKNDLITKDKYGDWCVPPESLELIRSKDSLRNTDGTLMASAYYYRLLETMKRFAVLAGKPGDVRGYDQLMVRIKTAFNKTFLKNGDHYDNNTVTANLLALYFGMVPEAQITAVKNRLIEKLKRDNMHISTGVIGTQWLLRGLTEFGYPDASFTLAINTTYPSWGYMVEQGATTIWELWNGNTANPQMNSQNHVMLLGDLITWSFEDLAGIQTDPAAPAFKKIRMQPVFVKGLDSVTASYDSPYGSIKSAWKRTGNSLTWNVAIPANASASVVIPSREITESGNPVNGKAEGKAEVTRLELGSGIYSFKAILNK